MKINFNEKYIYAPIKVLMLFNLFTIFIFVFGPVQWKINNELITVLYLLCNLTCLYYGFNKSIINYKIKHTSENLLIKKKLIYFIIIFTFIWFFPMLYIRLGLSSISLSGAINKLLDGLNNPLIVYKEKLELFEEAQGKKTSRLQLFDGLVSPIIYAFFPISILYFKKFNNIIRFGILIIFSLECLSWISIGTNKGITDFALVLFFMSLALNPSMYKLNLKKITIIFSIVGIILFFFIANMLSRFGANENSSVLDKIDFTVLNNPLKTGGIYGKMDIGIKFALMQITSYLSQGYYTVALALQEPFTWSYGFGNSYLGVSMWDKITGGNLIEMTYVGSLEKHYDINSKVAWHSIYTWLASDFTFVGVPLVMFVIGYALGTSWLDTVYKRTIYAGITFCLFAQMVFYFFANNQIISFAFLPFVVYGSLWLWERNNIKLKI